MGSLIYGMPDAKAFEILNGLITLVEDLARARSEWDGPYHPQYSVCLSLAAVLEFLRSVDRPNPGDRHRPLEELYGAIYSLFVDGTVVPLLKPYEPQRGQPRVPLPERATRGLAVAIADAIAKTTEVSREQADDIVARELDKLNFQFGNKGDSAAHKVSTAESLALYRRRLANKRTDEADRDWYQYYKKSLQERVSAWRQSAEAADNREIRRRLLDKLTTEVRARQGSVFRESASK